MSEEKLSRRYRRLVRVYPPGPRREELLDTLLQAAPPGRRRPTVGEAVNLVRCGLRARLGRPGSRGVVVLAVLVMLAGAYLGAFAAHRIGWEFAPALPSGQQAARLSATAFPGLHVWGGGDAELFADQDDGEGIRYGSAGYWVKHTAETRDVGAYSAGARDRLAGAGWTIHDYRVSDPEELVDGGAEYRASFWATSPGLVLSFSDYYWTGRPAYDSDGAAAFDLWRAPPPWLTPLALLGAAVGALAGWLLTCWVSRRTEPIRDSGPSLAVATTVALVLLLPGMVLTSGNSRPPDNPWWSGFRYLGFVPAMLSAAIAAVLLVATAAQAPAVRRAASAIATRVRHHPRRAAGVLLVAVLAALAPGALREASAFQSPCHPTGVPAAPAAPTSAGPARVQIFVSNASSPQERALIDAAIFRSRAGSLGELVWRPDSAEFRDTYCGGRPVPADAVATLPYFFDVELHHTATFPALVAEVQGMPGVVAIQYAASTGSVVTP